MSELNFTSPSVENAAGTENVKSIPVEPPSLALNWLRDFRNSNPVLFDRTTGTPIPIYGFSFDVSDVQKVVAGLNDNEHEVHFGIAKRSDGSHTLILAGAKVTKDADGNVTNRELLHHEENKPIYDYCDPCPPACPDSIIEF